ncbi:MAG TPA: N-acetylmuramoyl-L-alanine amidase [Saprospiraceae bacterium]|nr:N-acetylmuramoyl-L-alanine amidase [Saprospiraceae bacterium]
MLKTLLLTVFIFMCSIPQLDYFYHTTRFTNSLKFSKSKLMVESRKSKFNQTKKERNYKIKTIVLDAGHGGRDRGCAGKHSKEKVITLSVAKKLGHLLTTYYPEIKIIYTRDSDRFVPLHKRAELANKTKADLFISLHCNAISRSVIAGSETYVMGLHTAEENLEVAKRENSSLLLEENYQNNYDGFDPNSPEGHIILSMYQNAFLEQSILFADQIEKQITIQSHGRSRGVKQAGFVVLRQTAMPSVLVELGYLTNAKDEAYLLTTKGQDNIASAIFDAFQTYKYQTETNYNNNYTSTTQQQSKVKTTTISPSKERKSEITQQNIPETKIIKTKTKNTISYKIQMTSSQRPLNLFEGKWLKVNYTLEEVFQQGFYRYFATGFTSIEEAKLAKKSLDQSGFKDAFIVAFKNGKRVYLSETEERVGGY